MLLNINVNKKLNKINKYLKSNFFMFAYKIVNNKFFITIYNYLVNYIFYKNKNKLNC